jgi:hypothetical protein
MTCGPSYPQQTQARLYYSGPISGVPVLQKIGKTPYIVKLDVLASHTPHGVSILAEPAISILLEFFELNDIDDVVSCNEYSGFAEATQEEQREGFSVKLMYTCIAWIEEGRPVVSR